MRNLWSAHAFTLHYGFFHLGYLAFLVAEHSVHVPLEVIALAACGLGFLFSQRRTFDVQHAADVRGRPNLGALMFLPYLRIIPMHLGVIFAGEFAGGAASLVIFVILKTFADLGLDHADRRMAEKAVGGPRS